MNAVQPRSAATAEAALRLLSAGGVGPARVHRLVEAFGSAEAALRAPVDSVAAALRTSSALAARILAEARAADACSVVADATRLGARIIERGDEHYPQLLEVAPDPPALLFVRGELWGEPEPTVAIVGSRRASPYGRIHAGRIAEQLAAEGVTVVSGGARGIDAEAHRGALRAGGRTMAVLASGLRHPYPPEHAGLFEAIAEAGGAVVTEQCPAVEPRPELFPRRNRIVAAMSLLVVVVEAAERSGALLTARIAIDDLSREVGCLPGPVDANGSAGCNAAIRDGWARLIRGAPDVLELLKEARTLAIGAAERAVARRKAGMPEPDAGRPGAPSDHRAAAPEPAARPGVTAEPNATMSDDESAIVHGLGELGASGLDELEAGLGLGIPRIAAAILGLERRGTVMRSPTGAFELVGRRRRGESGARPGGTP